MKKCMVLLLEIAKKQMDAYVSIFNINIIFALSVRLCA